MDSHLKPENSRPINISKLLPFIAFWEPSFKSINSLFLYFITYRKKPCIILIMQLKKDSNFISISLTRSTKESLDIFLLENEIKENIQQQPRLVLQKQSLEVFSKKLFLNISQYSQENICAGVSF